MLTSLADTDLFPRVMKALSDAEQAAVRGSCRDLRQAVDDVFDLGVHNRRILGAFAAFGGPDEPRAGEALAGLAKLAPYLQRTDCLDLTGVVAQQRALIAAKPYLSALKSLTLGGHAASGPSVRREVDLYTSRWLPRIDSEVAYLMDRYGMTDLPSDAASELSALKDDIAQRAEAHLASILQNLPVMSLANDEMEVLGHLPCLTELTLKGPFLNSLPKAVKHCSSLQKLNLKDSQISRAESWLIQLPHLTMVIPPCAGWASTDSALTSAQRDMLHAANEAPEARRSPINGPSPYLYFRFGVSSYDADENHENHLRLAESRLVIERARMRGLEERFSRVGVSYGQPTQ